jgi:hypothetical protein
MDLRYRDAGELRIASKAGHQLSLSEESKSMVEQVLHVSRRLALAGNGACGHQRT